MHIILNAIIYYGNTMLEHKYYLNIILVILTIGKDASTIKYDIEDCRIIKIKANVFKRIF